LLAAQPALGQGNAAALLKKAKAHFDLQEYDQAEETLKEAYRLDPKPETLYAIAQAQRLGGACDRAIISYKNYLRTKPKDTQARSANENIDRCEAQLAAQKPVEPVKPDEPVSNGPVETPVEPQPVAVEDRALLTKPAEPVPETPAAGVPWTKNWAGHAMLIGGIALAAGGTFLALDGDKTIQEINDARFYDDFVLRSQDLDAARSRRTLGYVTAGAGSALVIGAIVLYIVRYPDEAGTRTARVGIDPRGAVQIAWGF
jgi:tetratricopeptide (TPR) repeat protein